MCYITCPFCKLTFRANCSLNYVKCPYCGSTLEKVPGGFKVYIRPKDSLSFE